MFDFVRQADVKRSETAQRAARRRTRRAPQRRPSPVAAVAVEPGAAEAAPESVEALVAGWAPRRRPASQRWDAVADVAREAVLSAGPSTAGQARDWLRALAFHLGSLQAHGHRTDDMLVALGDDMLARTLGDSTRGELSAASAAKHRGVLRTMRTALSGRAAVQKALATPGRIMSAPYAPSELAALHTWCRQANNVSARHVRAALLVGLSCGLDGRELLDVAGTEVRRTPWGLVVSAPGWRARQPRAVPVPAAYESELAAVALEIGDGPLVGTRAAHKRDLYVLNQALMRQKGLPLLDGGRLRATWLRDAIDARVSLLALRQAGAPLDGEKALAAACAGLTMPLQEYVTELRRGGKPFDASAFDALAEWDAA